MLKEHLLFVHAHGKECIFALRSRQSGTQDDQRKNWTNYRGIWTTQVPIWCDIQKWSMELFHSGTEVFQKKQVWRPQWAATALVCHFAS